MAEIKQYPKDRIIMIEFSEDELDKIFEIASSQSFTVNEVILACFQIGIIQLIAKTKRDSQPI